MFDHKDSRGLIFQSSRLGLHVNTDFSVSLKHISRCSSCFCSGDWQRDAVLRTTTDPRRRPAGRRRRRRRRRRRFPRERRDGQDRPRIGRVSLAHHRRARSEDHHLSARVPHIVFLRRRRLVAVVVGFSGFVRGTVVLRLEEHPASERGLRRRRRRKPTYSASSSVPEVRRVARETTVAGDDDLFGDRRRRRRRIRTREGRLPIGVERSRGHHDEEHDAEEISSIPSPISW